jgi:hypothetical protein
MNIKQPNIDITKNRLQIEFRAPNSLQHNGKIESKIGTLYGKVQASFNADVFTWPV